MMRLIGYALLAAALVGCGSNGLGFNTAALVTNFETSVQTEQMLAEFAFEASRGDIDLTQYNYTYTPPQGSLPGTLTITGGDFNFGSGDITINFTAAGDGGFVDPYLDDLTDDTQVAIVADVIFNGTGPNGETLDALADITVTTIQNDVNSAITMVTGTFDVSLDDYDFEIVANDVEMTLDLVNDTVTEVTGSIVGTADIPDFLFDIDFTIDGVGDQLQIGIDAVVTQINYTLALADL